MSMEIKPPTPERYLDETTKKNLNRIKTNVLGRKYDYVIVITADKTGVGLGKSDLSHLLCAYVDPNNYTISRVFFDAMDYRLEEAKLKPKNAFSFDEPDAFISTEAMTREQRKLKLKFAKIRQKMYFIVICTPNLLLLSKWFRGAGESRVNCVLRIVKRGVFYAYGDKTGSIKKIIIDTRNNQIKWPESDFIGFFGKIPENSDWWEFYLTKKNKYLGHAEENPKAVKLMRIEHAKMINTLTVREIAEIHKVHYRTVRKWIDDNMFGKRGVFIGLDGKKRVKMDAYRLGIARILKVKKKGRPKRKGWPSKYIRKKKR